MVYDDINLKCRAKLVAIKTDIKMIKREFRQKILLNFKAVKHG